MEYESRWQAHRARACDQFCWYCEHPQVGSQGWRIITRITKTRPKLGKAVTRAVKRLRVKELKRRQATP